MRYFEELVDYVAENPIKIANAMYEIQGRVLSRKIPNSIVTWKFNDGSRETVHFRMSDGFNYDKAASIPTSDFSYDCCDPRYTICMSSSGRIFAIVDMDKILENHRNDLKKKAVKGFVGFNLYKDWDDCVRIIYV